MRIGCLQFAPQVRIYVLLVKILKLIFCSLEVGDVDNNLNRADSVLSKCNPHDLDLLVLPELAFTGMSMVLRLALAAFL